MNWYRYLIYYLIKYINNYLFLFNYSSFLTSQIQNENENMDSIWNIFMISILQWFIFNYLFKKFIETFIRTFRNYFQHYCYICSNILITSVFLINAHLSIVKNSKSTLFIAMYVANKFYTIFIFNILFWHRRILALFAITFTRH